MDQRADILPTDVLLPLHLRRPDWLQSKIASRHRNMSLVAEPPYSVNGILPDYLFQAPLQFGNDRWASRLLMELEVNKSEGLRVLDLGTGAGQFVVACLERGHQAIGLSAHDYRVYPKYDDLTDQLPLGSYVVADAHHLADTTEIEGNFDLIVGSHSFMHFVDPLSVLEQSLNKLKPGGIFACDTLDNGTAYAFGATSEVVISTLAEAGLKTDGSFYTPYSLEFQTLFVYRDRTSCEVSLPVTYREHGHPD